MSSKPPFTIEQFYKFLSEQKLMAAKCVKCGKIHLPPRNLCDNCLSDNFDWMPISGKGKLLTYTIIHIAPAQFQSQAPYAIGIVQLERDLRIPGLIKDVTQEKLKIGMDLTIDFGSCDKTQTWPQWTRYCFRPC